MTKATKRRDKFNKYLKNKDFKKGMLLLKYNIHLEHCHDANFLPHWEGPFVFYHIYKNGSYQLQDLLRKLHQKRVNDWRLKPYLVRIKVVPSITLMEEEEDATFIYPKEQPDMEGLVFSLSDLFYT